MAQKKSRAEKIVSDTKKKASASDSTPKSKSKSSVKKTETAKKSGNAQYENPIPSTFVIAFVSIALFILFLVMAINPDGALVKFAKNIVLGLIGQAGFYFAIPGFLYLFVINTFGRKSATRMRSICVVTFVFCCGALYHLAIPTALMDQGIGMIPDLYTGGIDGITGGVLCGGFAFLLRWACGKPISFLILGTVAVFTLLGAMQITIPSIIRAIINRPRDDWEEEEDDYIEPAAIVVNHIANKKIQQKRQLREKRQQEREALAAAAVQEAPVVAAKPKKETPAAAPAKEPVEQKQPEIREPVAEEAQVQTDTVKQVPGKGAAFMNRIDVEIGAPLAGTSGYVKEEVPNVFEEPVSVAKPVRVEGEELETSRQMPKLQVNKPQAKPAEPVRAAKPQPKPEEVQEKKVSAKAAAESARQVAAEIAVNQSAQKPDYCFPPIDLLKRPGRGGGDGTEEMRENSRRLNETLASFRIDAHQRDPWSQCYPL